MVGTWGITSSSIAGWGYFLCWEVELVTMYIKLSLTSTHFLDYTPSYIIGHWEMITTTPLAQITDREELHLSQWEFAW